VRLSHKFAGFSNCERIWFRVIQNHILQLYWEPLLGQNISSDIEAIPPVRLLGWDVGGRDDTDIRVDYMQHQ
jgi:hypothetical protein